eukprot:4171075-Prymnesium_polylepis.1
MDPQAIAALLHAYGTVGHAPPLPTLRALQSRAAELAAELNSQDLANALWACARLGARAHLTAPPSLPHGCTLALRRCRTRCRTLTPDQCANACVRNSPPDASAMDALGGALLRQLPAFKPMELSSTGRPPPT